MLIGVLGDLRSIRSPSYGFEPRPDQQGSVFRLLGGGHRVENVGDPRRVYALRWEFLPDADYQVLHALVMGWLGDAPYVLVDPTSVNLLSAQQSTGTDITRTAAGFAAGGGTLASSTDLARTGARSLQWSGFSEDDICSTGETDTLTAADPDEDVPVAAGLDYTGSLWVARDENACTVRARLAWADAAGDAVDTDEGDAVALAAADTFERVTVTATAPATAALVRLQLEVTAATSTPTLHLDDLQLEQAAAASTARRGLGVPRVVVEPGSFRNAADLVGFWGVAATFLEV